MICKICGDETGSLDGICDNCKAEDLETHTISKKTYDDNKCNCDFTRLLETYDLLDTYDSDSQIINWIVEHMDQIRDVVGFNIYNVKRHKLMGNDVSVDLYGEDNEGKGIVFYADRSESTDQTLQWILFKAITSYSEKAIWVANEVQEEHSTIVKWLNDYHKESIEFFLVEAKRMATSKNKTLATSFRLIESPANGWRDCV